MTRLATYPQGRREGKASFPADLYDKLLLQARKNHRSVSQELIVIVEKAFGQEDLTDKQKSILEPCRQALL